jgi:trehalose/maltose hydrolase-like predicted phosphorylase
VLATFLAWDEISPEARTANFRYYEPRTGHGSSLSPSIHALIAARIGDVDCAEKYLKLAAEIDLGNNMGNAPAEYMQRAWGLWQAVVFGFARISTLTDGVSFAPHLITVLEAPFVSTAMARPQAPCLHRTGNIRVETAGEQPLRLRVESGSEIIAKPGHEYIIEKTEAGWGDWQMARSSSKGAL